MNPMFHAGTGRARRGSHLVFFVMFCTPEPARVLAQQQDTAGRAAAGVQVSCPGSAHPVCSSPAPWGFVSPAGLLREKTCRKEKKKKKKSHDKSVSISPS